MTFPVQSPRRAQRRTASLTKYKIQLGASCESDAQSASTQVGMPVVCFTSMKGKIFIAVHCIDRTFHLSTCDTHEIKQRPPQAITQRCCCRSQHNASHNKSLPGKCEQVPNHRSNHKSDDEVNCNTHPIDFINTSRERVRVGPFHTRHSMTLRMVGFD